MRKTTFSPAVTVSDTKLDKCGRESHFLVVSTQLDPKSRLLQGATHRDEETVLIVCICWSVLGGNVDGHHDNCWPRKISSCGVQRSLSNMHGIVLVIWPRGPEATWLCIFPLWSLFISILQEVSTAKSSMTVTAQISLQMILPHSFPSFRQTCQVWLCQCQHN